MNEVSVAKSSFLRSHWFWPAAVTVGVLNAFVLVLDGWRSPQIKELGVLFDLAILLPILYLICYRATGKRALVRCLAMACLGIWAAGHIVPDENHAILIEVGFLRYVGLAVLIAIEIRIGVEIFKLAFRSESDIESDTAIKQKAEQEGIPSWVATLMAWESRVWRKIWTIFRR
ncbi:hypothetical protein [Wenzhouxiangella marina]|uniref:Uncharacterized protein n=1 Tax=Wenzhouxiangella marina TaxID=1579979 RepID=A0A0K0XY04_9GAMM|nr:hypothetical protein [Wenzhouxiangella marina]AKS42555.1 hypothetical protein WM2015_2192 [Wenzhouxiangella marina]MBB6085665.1 hypothetical protein [Wenzhouxiangella marina]